jgi:phosphosulfolactate synthase
VSERASFLDLPGRSGKPRPAGITMVLDKGMPIPWVEPLLPAAAQFMDVWKMGWGTAYLEPGIAGKVALLGRYGVWASVGGTLLEIAWAQGRAPACLDWAAEVGFPCVEVSNGSVGMPAGAKAALIAEAARRFVVLSEVGSKDPRARPGASAWADEMARDLDAGATWVVAEGRESGTVGLYEPDGSVRKALVDALVAVDPGRVLFEAPRKDQQAWLIRHLGPDVNLGNVAPTEVMGLEALRLGLRADTIGLARKVPVSSGPLVSTESTGSRRRSRRSRSPDGAPQTPRTPTSDGRAARR